MRVRAQPPAPGLGVTQDPPGAAADDGVPRHDSGTITDPWVGRLAASDGMFVTDDRQRIVAWSSAAQRMLGFSPEEAVGRTCYQVVMGREPDGHPICGRNCRVTRNARHGRGTAAYEVTARARDGSAKCLSNSVLVVEGPAGAFHVIHLLREASGAAPVMRRMPVEAQDRPQEPMVETLTRRELEVLRLFSQGATIDEIAESLTISVFTARNHIANIGRKLGARSRLETVLLAMRRGLV
jgi:PAS domain S-box-containing protein